MRDSKRYWFLCRMQDILLSGAALLVLLPVVAMGILVKFLLAAALGGLDV